MNKDKFIDWINSLNPVVIDVDEQGNIVNPLQLDELDKIIEAEVNKLNQGRSNPDKAEGESNG